MSTTTRYRVEYLTNFEVSWRTWDSTNSLTHAEGWLRKAKANEPKWEFRIVEIVKTETVIEHTQDAP